MSLENTNWTLTENGTPTTSTLAFGKNEAAAGGNPGGYGTKTTNYASAGPIVVDIMWMEDGNGRFMFQTQGPTDTGVTELPTYTGTYNAGTALGWASNFNAIWGSWGITMTQNA